MAVDLKSMLLTTQAAVPAMEQRGGGSVICVSSVAGLRGYGRTAYAAAKAGVIGFVTSVAVQLGPRGIRVNAIAPGTVWTPMVEDLGPEARERRRRATPLGTEGTAWDVGWGALYLASDESRWVTGQVLVIDAGLTVDDLGGTGSDRPARAMAPPPRTRPADGAAAQPDGPLAACSTRTAPAKPALESGRPRRVRDVKPGQRRSGAALDGDDDRSGDPHRDEASVRAAGGGGWDARARHAVLAARDSAGEGGRLAAGAGAGHSAAAQLPRRQDHLGAVPAALSGRPRSDPRPSGAGRGAAAGAAGARDAAVRMSPTRSGAIARCCTSIC